MQVVPAISIEGRSTTEVLRLSVPSPEPRKFVFQTRRLLTAILVPLDVWLDPKNPRAFPPDIDGHHEWPNIQTNAVILIWLPTDRLLGKGPPSDEDVVRRLSIEDLLELLLQ